ncbi:hypothetical protein ACFWWS_36865, partial [Streptomyces sp. NPDC059083]|uniref:hypothetical protein n=1 Tax=Streptomyces sp. NPDC059083 TaxID=3346721 RepID=UPI0036A31C29
MTLNPLRAWRSRIAKLEAAREDRRIWAAHLAELHRRRVIVELEQAGGRRVIETVEELDTLDWPCLVREITPEDELEFYPQIWERAF